MRKKELPPVIIVGGNHHNTQGVIRSLGQKGIKSCVIIRGTTTKGCFVLKSRYVHEGYVEKDEEAIVNRIVELAKRLQAKAKSVVICTSDDLSSLIDRHYRELSQYCCLPGAVEQGHITELMGKSRQMEMATDIGMNVPKTWHIKSVAEINNVDFPCIIKPEASINGSKSDIQIFQNAEEFKKYYESSDKGSILTQSYIERDFEYQIIGCSLKGGAEVVIPGYTRIIRSSDRTNTGVLLYQAVNFDAELDKCRQLINTTGYSGLFSMEFIHGKDGKNYFLEINFRNDGNAICVTAAGINLPYIWLLANSGNDYEIETLKEVSQVKAIPVFDDYIHFVKKGKINKLKWLCEVMKADCLMDVDWKDLRPLLSRIMKY